jgi:hypothetical protein
MSHASQVMRGYIHMGNVRLRYEIGLIKDLILMIDEKLADLLERSNDVDDPDALGYFDSAEQLTGLGLVACQTYMTAVYGILGIAKRDALLSGPRHSTGSTIVALINHGANYWKHNNEWSVSKDSRQREYTKKAFESVGFPVDLDYPLSGMLTELVAPEYASFAAILDKLEDWVRELQTAA